MGKTVRLKLKLSKHTREKMAENDVDEETIKRVLENPEGVRENKNGGGKEVRVGACEADPVDDKKGYKRPGFILVAVTSGVGVGSAIIIDPNSVYVITVVTIMVRGYTQFWKRNKNKKIW